MVRTGRHWQIIEVVYSTICNNDKEEVFRSETVVDSDYSLRTLLARNKDLKYKRSYAFGSISHQDLDAEAKDHHWIKLINR